jgi:hypothetical protein
MGFENTSRQREDAEEIVKHIAAHSHRGSGAGFDIGDCVERRHLTPYTWQIFPDWQKKLVNGSYDLDHAANSKLSGLCCT